MKTVIIKYNGGNTQSVLFALERLGVEAIITDDPEIIRTADKVIFPGVGEAGSAMQYLSDRKLDQLIPSLTQPVLGICLGMQLMCKKSEEGDTECLGIFDVNVQRFTDGKVPHMGWNTVSGNSSLLKGITGTNYYYFVHSYYAPGCTATTGTTEYHISFTSILERSNFYGVQFHPEKSAHAGNLILQNFLAL